MASVPICESVAFFSVVIRYLAALLRGNSLFTPGKVSICRSYKRYGAGITPAIHSRIILWIVFLKSNINRTNYSPGY